MPVTKKDNNNKVEIIISWLLVVFTFVHILIYKVLDFDFISQTDVIWYDKTVKNLIEFDPAIQPIFPFLVRSISELLNWLLQFDVDLRVSYIIVQFFCAILYFKIVYKCSSYIVGINNYQITKEWEFVFFSVLFVYVNLFFLIIPRANTMLYSLEILIIYQILVKPQKTFRIWILFALLPLIHKSGIIFSFFMIVQLIIENFLKTLNFKNVLYNLTFYSTTILPLAIYVFLGTIKGPHQSFKWWFTSYQHLEYNQENTLNLITFDGIFSRIYFGIIHLNFSSIFLFAMVMFYYLTFLIYGNRVSRFRIFILGYLSFLLAFLPYQEINSFLNYTIGLIPIMFLNPRFNRVFLNVKIIIVCSLVNIIWLIYSYFYLVK